MLTQPDPSRKKVFRPSTGVGSHVKGQLFRTQPTSSEHTTFFLTNLIPPSSKNRSSLATMHYKSFFALAAIACSSFCHAQTATSLVGDIDALTKQIVDLGKVVNGTSRGAIPSNVEVSLHRTTSPNCLLQSKEQPTNEPRTRQSRKHTTTSSQQRPSWPTKRPSKATRRSSRKASRRASAIPTKKYGSFAPTTTALLPPTKIILS